MGCKEWTYISIFLVQVTATLQPTHSCCTVVIFCQGVFFPFMFFFFLFYDPVLVPTLCNTPLVGGWKEYLCLFPVLQGLWGTSLSTRAVCTTSRAAPLLHHRGRSLSTATTGQRGGSVRQIWILIVYCHKSKSRLVLKYLLSNMYCNPFPTEWCGRQRRQRLVMCFRLRLSTSVRNTGRGFSQQPVRTRGGWGTAHSVHLHTQLTSRSYI